MNKVFNIILGVVLIGVSINGCSTYQFPGVHRITIQQGNVVTQTMIDKLKPGMTKSQVHYVLGTTVIADALNNDRWDYIYTIQVPGNLGIQKKLQIYFVEGRLSHFDGDYVPTDAAKKETEEPEEESKA
ncbi:MAG: outer membrane protein assembly factor BamE [Pseudomonadales bacterium]|nr:outer membrane protein assembly factor BamE [Pseudomonadales bacterium]